MRGPSILKPGENDCLARRFISLVLFMVLILGFVSGCGKKGDPVPLRFSPPEVVSNLRAEKVEQGIKLRWSTAITDGSFKIFRSEQFPDEEICEGCPRNYNVVSELAIGDPKLSHEASSRNYSWIDFNVASENDYFYRIVVCDASGFCSELSDTVSVTGKKKSLMKENERNGNIDNQR
ncbi:MAG: hypothetical protein A4E66_00508 [Syntrophus sp. PtaB.Bin001]|nr:MAG: hypothetical protein A4E66_00508 [Syntrophus sp. PtaB.Bin001]